MPELWPASDWEWELHARGEGWLDEFAPADVADDRPDFRKPRTTLRGEEPLRRGTFEELREMKIKAFECPLPGCSGKLDESFFCSHCGFVSTPGGSKSQRGEPKKEREAA